MLEIGAVFMRTETELILGAAALFPADCSSMVSRSTTRIGGMPRSICAVSRRAPATTSARRKVESMVPPQTHHLGGEREQCNRHEHLHDKPRW
jgi:hypothetical protein